MSYGLIALGFTLSVLFAWFHGFDSGYRYAIREYMDQD